MSYFNSNISESSGGESGLLTKFVKTVIINTDELAEVDINLADDVSNYTNITNERIIVEIDSVHANFAGGSSGSATLAHSYNPETGVLTITSTSSKIPFSFTSSTEVTFAIYIAGAIQMPAPPIYEPVESITVNSKAASQADSVTSNWNFVVNVGQMAILTGGMLKWNVSNDKAILTSSYGTANSVGDKTNQGKDNFVTIVKPTKETGGVACSAQFGGTTWAGGTYTLLDIN